MWREEEERVAACHSHRGVAVVTAPSLRRPEPVTAESCTPSLGPPLWAISISRSALNQPPRVRSAARPDRKETRSAFPSQRFLEAPPPSRLSALRGSGGGTFVVGGSLGSRGALVAATGPAADTVWERGSGEAREVPRSGASSPPLSLSREEDRRGRKDVPPVRYCSPHRPKKRGASPTATRTRGR